MPVGCDVSDPGQVEAIVHLVSSAVPKLNATNVTVTDSTGKLLSAAGMAGAASTVGDQRSAQAAAAEAERQNQLIELAKNIGLALLLLLALLIGFRKSRKKTTRTVEIGDLSSVETESVLPPTAMHELPPAPAEYALEDDEMHVIEATPVDPQIEARAAARSEIGALVEENPDEVARLLRGWISERK